MQPRTLFRVAGIVPTPIPFVTRPGMWAVVIAWAVVGGTAAIVLTGLLASPTVEPDSAGAVKGVVVLAAFVIPLVVGPLLTWRWLRRRVR